MAATRSSATVANVVSFNKAIRIQGIIFEMKNYFVEKNMFKQRNSSKCMGKSAGTYVTPGLRCAGGACDIEARLFQKEGTGSPVTNVLR